MHKPLLALGLLYCACAVTAATYEVGPNQTITSPANVPWESLNAGDTVLIDYRATPYLAKWVICRQGTANAPITVRGVPGPNGELPIISGSNSVTRTTLDYWGENRSVIKIGGANVPADTMPRYIVIENLEVRNGRPPYTYKAASGSTGTYQNQTAGIWIEKGENITVRNCTIDDCGNGLFVSSGTVASTNILVESCLIYGNGNQGSLFEHNLYTAALGITFQYNHFGPLRAGCPGNNLKDRSAGLVIRYNWIAGGSRQLDLVDATDSTILSGSSLYHQTYVYGNVFVEPAGDGNNQIVHYGGDSGNTAIYRKGTLYFYQNTVVSKRTDSTVLFRLDTNAEGCDASDNIIETVAGTPFGLLNAAGTLNFSNNWLRAGYTLSDGTLTGTVHRGNNISTASPGFVDEANNDFHLSASSPCCNMAAPLNPAVLPTYDDTEEYVVERDHQARFNDGARDLGAFEVVTPPEPTITLPPSDSTNAVGSSAVFTVGVSGIFPMTYRWFKGTDALSDGGNIFGSTTANLTVSSLTAGDIADYSVAVSNAFGSATSSSATIVLMDPPVVTVPPASQTIGIGDTPVFLVSATGDALHYQWRRNGSAIFDGTGLGGTIIGAQTSSLTLQTVGMAGSGSYAVVVKNLVGNTTSAAATLVVTNPYATISGVYYGLFYENDVARPGRSGFLKLTMQTNGIYTGSVTVKGVAQTIGGRFIDYTSHVVVSPAIALDMTIDVSTGTISGQAVGSTWTAPLLANRSTYTAPSNVRSTISLISNNDGSTAPGGDIVGTLNVNTRGAFSFSGFLSDNSAFKVLGGSLAHNGDLPVYASLYGNTGVLIGWLSKTSGIYGGTLKWIKQSPFGTNYINGFTNTVNGVSSIFPKLSSTTRALAMTNGIVALSGGSLATPVTNHVVFNANNTITVSPSETNGLKLSLNITNGYFGGRFIDPGTHKTNTIRGILMKQQTEGRGYFTAPRTGEFLLQVDN